MWCMSSYFSTPACSNCAELHAIHSAEEIDKENNITKLTTLCYVSLVQCYASSFVAMAISKSRAKSASSAHMCSLRILIVNWV